jgi:hypothetical protein
MIERGCLSCCCLFEICFIRGLRLLLRHQRNKLANNLEPGERTVP